METEQTNRAVDLSRLGDAMQKTSNAFRDLGVAASEASKTYTFLISSSPPFLFDSHLLMERLMTQLREVGGIPSWRLKGFSSRRAMVEDDLGYQLPDWAWEVDEWRRRTEGSGNGRIMRD